MVAKIRISGMLDSVWLRWMAIAAVGVAIGGFVYALGEFVFGLYRMENILYGCLAGLSWFFYFAVETGLINIRKGKE